MTIYRVNHKSLVSKRCSHSKSAPSLTQQDSPATLNDSDIELLEQPIIGEPLTLSKQRFNSLELIAKEILADWRYDF